MRNIEINCVYNKVWSPDAPYGVEVLIDCSESDPTQGGSEMSWFETEKEQSEYFEKVSNEYNI